MTEEDEENVNISWRGIDEDPGAFTINMHYNMQSLWLSVGWSLQGWRQENLDCH